MTMPTSKDLVARCASDGEFALAARYWTGGLRFEIGEAVLEMTLENGRPCPGAPGQRPNTISLSGPSELWSQLLAPVPPRFLNDLGPMVERGIRFTGDRVLYAQYFAAIMRAIELLREPNAQAISTGVGHFPMAENPAVFLEYLLPVLEQIRIAGTGPPNRVRM